MSCWKFFQMNWIWGILRLYKTSNAYQLMLLPFLVAHGHQDPSQARCPSLCYSEDWSDWTSERCSARCRNVRESCPPCRPREIPVPTGWNCLCSRKARLAGWRWSCSIGRPCHSCLYGIWPGRSGRSLCAVISNEFFNFAVCVNCWGHILKSQLDQYRIAVWWWK